MDTQVPENVLNSFNDNFEKGVLSVLLTRNTPCGGTAWILRAKYLDDHEERYRAIVYKNGDITWDSQLDTTDFWQSTPWQVENHLRVSFRRSLPEYYGEETRSLEVVKHLFDYEGYRYTHYQTHSEEPLDFILKQTVASYVSDTLLTAQTFPKFQWETYDQVKVDYILDKIAEEKSLTPLQESFLEEFPDYSDHIETLQEVDVFFKYLDDDEEPICLASLYEITVVDLSPGMFDGYKRFYFIKLICHKSYPRWLNLTTENEKKIWRTYMNILDKDIRVREKVLIKGQNKVIELQKKFSFDAITAFTRTNLTEKYSISK